MRVCVRMLVCLCKHLIPKYLSFRSISTAFTPHAMTPRIHPSRDDVTHSKNENLIKGGLTHVFVDEGDGKGGRQTTLVAARLRQTDGQHSAADRPNVGKTAACQELKSDIQCINNNSQ